MPSMSLMPSMFSLSWALSNRPALFFVSQLVSIMYNKSFKYISKRYHTLKGSLSPETSHWLSPVLQSRQQLWVSLSRDEQNLRRFHSPYIHCCVAAKLWLMKTLLQSGWSLGNMGVDTLNGHHCTVQIVRIMICNKILGYSPILTHLYKLLRFVNWRIIHHKNWISLREMVHFVGGTPCTNRSLLDAWLCTWYSLLYSHVHFEFFSFFLSSRSWDWGQFLSFNIIFCLLSYFVISCSFRSG